MIMIGEGMLEVLRKHKEQQEQSKTRQGERWQENELIFPSSVGTPFNPSNLRIDFNRTLARAGLSKIRFHDLRHTAASLLINHNVPVIVVSKMLGHSKPSITLDIYGHLYHEMEGEAAEIMDKLVAPSRSNYRKKHERMKRDELSNINCTIIGRINWSSSSYPLI
jgi:integrase